MTHWSVRTVLILPLVAIALSAQSAPELVVSVGHAGAPFLATFAGGFLATASSSNIALIDLSTGITTAHLPHPSFVAALEASPSGELLAVSTCDHFIQLWDVKTRTVRRRIALTQECAESVSFSADGALLAAGEYRCCPGGGGLQIWDVGKGTLTRRIAKGIGFRAVAFGRNGRWLIGVEDSERATVYEWPSGRELRTYEGLDGAGASESAAFGSPDGNYFGWVGLHRLQVWDMRTGTRVPLPHTSAIGLPDRSADVARQNWTEHGVEATVAEFLNDGRLMYADNEVAVIVTLPNGPVQVLPLEKPKTEWFGDVGFTHSPRWLKIRRDGLMIAGTDDARTVLWDIPTRKLRDLQTAALTEARSLQWSRTGIVVWADFGSGVRAWNDRSGEPFQVGGNVSLPEAVAFDPDGRRLAVTDSSAVHILDVQRRRSLASIELPPGGRRGIAFSPDGSRLAFVSSKEFAIFDARLRRQMRLSRLDEHTGAEYVAFSPDGRWIAAGLSGQQPAVKVWSSTQTANTVTLDRNRLTYGPQPPAFSSDSRWLATFSKGDSLMLWSTEFWAVDKSWKLPGTGRALAFAPQGSRLAIAGDAEAAIWDAATGQRLVTFTGPESSQFTEIAWSPDGSRIATQTDDGVLRFWNADGRLLASLYTLASSRDWLLVAADGRVDGSDRALSNLAAWRTGDQVILDKGFTDRRRVRGLWRFISR